MNYIALYRKWRPMTFDEVVEQNSVVTILKNSVKTRRIAHAYLFCGTRGTGKTSLAKIFSRAVNCLAPVDGNPCNQCDVCKGILNDSILDVMEIDAASNTGVDSIRAIIDESNYQATKAEFKVFIIDEVHMLSTQAFNALLKTLEEPPENVIFILATTEPHKLPVTILSRCQRYDFKRISRDGIVARLEEICHSTGTLYEPSALTFLAGKADGALRDAISLLDQTMASCQNEKITLDAARHSVGAIERTVIEDFASSILRRDSFNVLTLVDRIFSEGADPSNFICELIDLFREMLVVLSTRTPEKLIYETGEDLERLKKLAEQTNIKEITLMIRELSSLENSLKWSVQRKIIFEAGMLSLCDRSWSRDTEVTDRILALERNVADLAANGLKTVYSGKLPDYVHMPAESVKADRDDEFEDAYTIGSEPENMPDASELKQSDPKDWKDFLSNLQEMGKNALAATLDNFGVSYPIGGVLYVTSGSDQIISRMRLDEMDDVLSNAASRAFGKKLRVIIESEEKFAARIPGLVEAVENGTETEEDKKYREAEERLQAMIDGSPVPEPAKVNSDNGASNIKEPEQSENIMTAEPAPQGENPPLPDEADIPAEDDEPEEFLDEWTLPDEG